MNQRCDSWLVQGIEALGRNVGTHATRLAGTRHSQGSALSDALAQPSSIHSVDALHAALLKGQFAAALNICLAFRASVPHDSTAVYLQLLLPTITELGRDWSEDRAGFDQIAFAYSLMHKIIETLGSKHAVASKQRIKLTFGRVIVAVAPEDTHEFGARIMAESLIMHGWDVIFVDGFSTAKIASILKHDAVNALAISVSTDTAFVGLADMISDWRCADSLQRTEIIVGGSAIMAPFDQYNFLQADHVGLRINEVSDHLLRQVTSDSIGRRNLS